MNPEQEHGPEHITTPENSLELEQAAAERLRELETNGEKGQENKSEKLEKIREQLEKQPEAPKAKSEKESTPVPFANRLDKLVAYGQTLKSLQSHFKPAQRSFSKFIHSPAIDKASEVIGKTVMRPSVTLGASLTALVLGAFFYITAKRYGFALSGSEFIISLLVGSVIGISVELIYHFVKGLKR